MKKTRGAFMVCSWDTQWGGFYLHRGKTSIRICLGYFAITLVREPLDDIVKDAMLHRSRLHRLDEYIICSGIWFDDGKKYAHQPKNIETGIVVAGRRHHNCYSTLANVTGRTSAHLDYEKVQGFITSQDRFVDRKEAAKIAFRNGQTIKEKKTLFSEDLY